MVERLHFSSEGGFEPLRVVAQGLWVFDLEQHRIAWANAAGVRLWRADSLDELLLRDFSSDSPSAIRRMHAIFEHSPPGQAIREAWTIYPLDAPVSVDCLITPLTFGPERRRALLVEGSAADVSDRDAGDLRLLEAMRATPAMISYFRMSGELISMNPAASFAYCQVDDAGGAATIQLLDRFSRRLEGERLLNACLQDGQSTEDLRAETLTGTRIHRFDLRRGRDPVTGEPILLLLEDDISERDAALAALEVVNASLEERVAERSAKIAESNRETMRLLSLLRQLVDNLNVMVAYIGADRKVRLANQGYARWFYQTPASIVGMEMKDVLKDRYPIAGPFISRVLKGERVEFERTSVGSKHDRNVIAQYIPHFANDTSTVIGYFALIEDVTERKLMQAQLDQSQRLAAVGRLTGGVAHDFNNLLGVVMGNADLLEGRLGQDDPQVGAIARAAERGSELTRSLLAFARSQKLSPRTIDLSKSLPEMATMLSVAVGEEIHVEVEIAPGLWPILADPGPLENALLNLAGNARDAMAEGGAVKITAANFTYVAGSRTTALDMPTGDYVRLSVTDTGIGMPDVVKARAFEPFYTTKDVGYGSGLGLSMVYGFVKQSGGDATIDNSQPNSLTITLYLPRAAEAATAIANTKPFLVHGDGETVLVLEDNEELRALAVRVIESLGYNALSASAVSDAWRILHQGARVDLLLADINLPGDVTGPRFAETVREEWPELPIVFMSGSLENIALGASTDLGARFVAKPFRRVELAEVLRSAFDTRIPAE